MKFEILKLFGLSDINADIHASKVRDSYVKSNIPNYILEYIRDETSFLSENIKLSERIYHVLHDIKDVGRCIFCNRETRFTKKKYLTYCSSACANKHKASLIVKNEISHEESQHYSCDPIKLAVANEKRVKTNLLKYGKDNVSKLPHTREKAINSYNAKSDIEKEDIKERIKSTNLERYGGVAPCSSMAIVDKVKKTQFERYGSWYLSTHTRKNSRNENYLNTLSDKEWLYNEHITLKKPAILIAKEIGCTDSTVINYFKFHEIVNQKGVREPVVEKEFQSFLVENRINYIKNSRKILDDHLEIDFYLPDYKIGIEFHGLYWHSHKGHVSTQIQRKHLMKLELSERKDIRLYQFFEDETNKSFDNIKSKILNDVGIISHRIYARKTEVREIGTPEYRIFCDENHLQGYFNAGVKIGLFSNGILVSVMSFGKSRYNKAYDWEMIRYCTKLGYNIIGGASKLFTFFIRKFSPTSVISYCDRRYSRGDIYNKLGFSHVRNTKPAYFVVNGPKRESRLKYQKHKISKPIEEYRRIWDCGQSVWEWIYSRHA